MFNWIYIENFNPFDLEVSWFQERIAEKCKCCFLINISYNSRRADDKN